MVLVEHAPRFRDIDRLRIPRLPRQLGRELEPGAQHRVFTAAFLHALEPLQLLARMLQRLFRHACGLDLLLQLLDLGSAVFALAELLADLAHLLAQHVLALALVELFLGLVADFLGKLQHLDTLAKRGEHAVEPPAQIEALQHFLLLLARDVEQVRDHVGEQARRSHGFDDRRKLFRRIGQQVDRLDRLFFQLQEARLDLRPGLFRRFDHRDARHQERPPLEELAHAKARLPLHHQVVRGLGDCDMAQGLADAADPVQVGRTDFVFLAIALQQEADAAIRTCSFLQRRYRRGASDGERRNRSREQDCVPQRNDDERIVRDRFHFRGFGLGCRHGCATATRPFVQSILLLPGPDTHAISFRGKVGVGRPFCKSFGSGVRAISPTPDGDKQI